MQSPEAERWPLAEHSRIVRVRPHAWHVQQAGQGPDILLLHGTGASTHSWRYIYPLLTGSARVMAIDLPGHGFTRLGNRMRSSLDCVADDVAALCRAEGIAPALIVGHSAGAAVALRVVDRMGQGARVVGINPALKPFDGIARTLFPMAARALAMMPGLTGAAARQMRDPSRVLSLLRGTGSQISTEQANLYARLFRDRVHVDGALLMMAQWKLDGLLADLPRIAAPTLFLTGSGDRMVPPVTAVQAADRMPDAVVESIDGRGHLLHEEDPGAVAARVLDWLHRGECGLSGAS
ncbi:alpha/beta fold hydrolase BchO [Citreimonas sp.]|uniref:alpha/beta fold hydrolase BchO n=1 Tax=Citreimonas sp. TaxID=3036715 RepID=UPI0035C7C733